MIAPFPQASYGRSNASRKDRGRRQIISLPGADSVLPLASVSSGGYAPIARKGRARARVDRALEVWRGERAYW